MTGSHVRLVVDTAPTIGATLCLKWPDGTQRLCGLPKGHRGTCLVIPKFPRTDISDGNPRWQKPQAAA